MRTLFVAIAAALILTSCRLEGLDHIPPGSTPSAELGQRLFQQKGCIACHNANASGGLSLEAPNLRGISLTYLAVLKQVRAPKGKMAPRSKEQASDEEIAAIYAWLQTFPKQEPTLDLAEADFPTPIPEATLIAQATEPPSPTPIPSAQPPRETDLPPPSPTATPTPAPTDTAAPDQPTSTPLPTATDTPTLVPPPATSVPPTAPPIATPLPQLNIAIDRLIAAQQNADTLKVAADYAKDASATVDELHNYVNQGLSAAQALQNEVNNIRAEASGNLPLTLDQLQPHLDSYLQAAQAGAGTSDFAAGKAQAATMVVEARIFVLPLAQQLLVDAGSVGIVRGRIVDQAGQGLANAAVTIAFGRYKRGLITDANGFFTAANIPAIKPIEVKAYQSGFIYHEEHTEVAPGGTSTIQITLPTQGSDAPAISVSDFAVTPTENGTTLRMRATHPQNNLAEDQIFALNPALGIAVVLLGQGGDIYESTVPFAPGGRWYFFAVDHKCFSSNIVPIDF